MHSSGTLAGEAYRAETATRAAPRVWMWGLLVTGGVAVTAVLLAMWLRGPNGSGAEHVLAAAPAAGGAAEKPAADAPPQGRPAAPATAPTGTEASVAVSVVPLTVRKVQRTVNAVGSFHGFDEVTVVAEVSGIVSKIHHEVGDIVRPGEILLEIDPTDYQLVVEETRRTLELDATRLGVAEENIQKAIDLDPEQIQALVGQVVDIRKLPVVVRAQEQLDNAQTRQERAQQLRDRGSMSPEEYDQRVTDFEVAKSNFDQALLDARAALAGVKLRLVMLKIANRKLSLTKVKVPTPTARQQMPKEVRYAVVERKATEGEMLKDSSGTSSATYELVMDGVLKLKAAVPERYVSQVKEGQQAEIQVDAYPNETFKGQVIRINPKIDRTSRTFEVEVFVENPQRQLKAGGFAKVDLLTYVDANAWTVPAEAIVSYAGSIKVFVIRAGRAHVIPVVPGVEGRGWVELVRAESPDLRQDDKVITSGQEKLAEGVAVFDRGEGARKQ
jgi:multidrug efflux pump subunit AcrA (membrane-fusion protein)